MKGENSWVVLVDYGVANRYSYPDHDEIEINKELLKYPELLKGIMKHEIGHTSGRYKMEDLRLDFHDGIKKPGYWKFIRKTKSSWYQFLPVWWTKSKGLIFDFGSLMNWLILFLLLLLNLKIFERLLTW